MTGLVHCRVEIGRYSTHAEQIVAGFCELARAGSIDLEFVRQRPSAEALRVQIQADIDGRRVAYDTYDDGRDGLSVSAAEQAGFDFYFKRSFDPVRHGDAASRCVVGPLGLNYLVSPDGARLRDKLSLRDARRLKGRFAGRARRIRTFESPPLPDPDPHVLFMARAWNPQHLSDESVARDWVALNDARAEYIRSARREFGRRFYGGLFPDDFARRFYGDCLLASASAGSQRAFLGKLRQSSICIATTGLFGSIGWKMAEYLAASKAVLSEPLKYGLPGGFAPEINYLEFSSPRELCEAVERLLSDATLRNEQMRANWEYYQRWVRPDAQVLRTIEAVLVD